MTPKLVKTKILNVACHQEITLLEDTLKILRSISDNIYEYYEVPITMNLIIATCICLYSKGQF